MGVRPSSFHLPPRRALPSKNALNDSIGRTSGMHLKYSPSLVAGDRPVKRLALDGRESIIWIDADWDRREPLLHACF
jgi:hypothetical protein